MGLILDFGLGPSPGTLIDIANNSVVSVHSDVLHRDRLLSRSAVPVKALSKDRDCSLCPVSHLKVAASRLKTGGAIVFSSEVLGLRQDRSAQITAGSGLGQK
jgi:hypothetical protein